MTASEWDRANAARLLEWGRAERRAEAARAAVMQAICRANREASREWAARLALTPVPQSTAGQPALTPALVVGLLSVPLALIFAAFLGVC